MNKYTPPVILLLFFLFSAYLMYVPLTDHDIWHHMLIAKDFLETGHLAAVDKFTVIGEGRTYQPYAWLGGMVFYGVYSLFGDSGIVGFRLLFLVGCILLLVYLCQNRKSYLWLSMVMGAAASLLLAYRLERPDIFSVFFLLLLVEKLYFSYDWTIRRKCVVGLLVMLLWVNLHPFSLLMIPIGVIFLLGSLLEYLTSNDISEKKLWMNNSKQSLLLLCCITFGSLIHPYPIQNYYYSFLQRSDFTSYATEWRPLNLFAMSWQIDAIYLVFILLLLIYLILGISTNKYRIPLNSLFVISFITWMSISSVRFMWMWILLFPIIAGWLSNMN